MSVFSENLLKDNFNVKKCDLCGNIINAITIETLGIEKNVCSKCVEAIFLKTMYIGGFISFDSVSTIDIENKPIKDDKRKKRKIKPIQEKSIFTKDELSYIRAIEAGISDEEIARLKGVSIEEVLKIANEIDKKVPV